MSTEQTNAMAKNSGAVIGEMKSGSNLNINNYASVARESQLRKILNCLLDAPIDEEPVLDKSAFTIDDKLDFNNVVDGWFEIITEEFFLFESTITGTFKNSIDGISPKGKFLLQMKRYYRDAKEELGLDAKLQDEIRQNSTNILNKVFEYMYSFLETKNEIYENFDKDNIKVLVAFGFVECKILEKPKG